MTLTKVTLNNTTADRLDQAGFCLDDAQMQNFVEHLEALPINNPQLNRLMAIQPPWKIPKG